MPLMFGILSPAAAVTLDGATMPRPVAHLANLDLNLLVPSPGQTAPGSAFTTLNRHK